MALFHRKEHLAILFFPFTFVGLASAVSPDRGLLSLVPPGAQMAAGVSARQPGQPDNFVLMTHNHAVDLEDFFALTSGDGSRIVHQIVLVALSGKNGELERA